MDIFLCPICLIHLNDGNLEDHFRNNHNEDFCPICFCEVTPNDFNNHFELVHRPENELVRELEQQVNNVIFDQREVERAIDIVQRGGGNLAASAEGIEFIEQSTLRHFSIFEADVEDLHISDPSDLLTLLKNKIVKLFENSLNKYGNFRTNFTIQCLVSRENDEGELEFDDETYFSTQIELLTNSAFFEEHIQNSTNKLSFDIENFTRNGSNWVLENIIKFSTYVSKYTRRPGLKYIPLPKPYDRCNSLLNIKNNNNYCIKYCLLALKHPINDKRKAVKPETYEKYWGEVNDKGVEYPIHYKDMLKLEKQNNLAINIFEINEKNKPEMSLCSRNMKFGSQVLNLLYIENDFSAHFVLIKNLNGFLKLNLGKNIDAHLCYKCNKAFGNSHVRDVHFVECAQNGVQIPVMPKKDSVLKFDELNTMMRRKFMCVLDLEVLPQDTKRLGGGKYTRFKSLHVPVTYSYIICESHSKKIRFVREGKGEGTTLMRDLIDQLESDYESLKWELSLVKKHGWTWEQMVEYRELHPVCGNPSCQRVLHDIKDRFIHHDHVSGEVIASVCGSCNRRAYKCYKLPVFIHNLNYDLKFLIHGLTNEHQISCLNKSKEKYLMLEVNNSIQFIDSLSFFANASLDKVSAELLASGPEHFSLLSDIYKKRDGGAVNNHLGDVNLLTKKGSFPYEKFKSLKELESTNELSPQSDFYSRLNIEELSDDVYKSCQDIWTSFKCKNMLDFLQVYNLSDCGLLLCSLTYFQRLMYDEFQLDVTNFISLPSFAYQAMLKTTAQNINLLSEGQYDILTKFETIRRGGLSTVGDRRFAEAYHENIEGFNTNNIKTDSASYSEDDYINQIVNLIDAEVEKINNLEQPGITPNPIEFWNNIRKPNIQVNEPPDKKFKIEESYHSLLKEKITNVANSEPKIPTVIVGVDASNLYGKGLSMPLPMCEFTEIQNPELSEIDFLSIDPNDNEGYIINADFYYPKSIRKKTNPFPLMPEHYSVKWNDLSSFQHENLKGKKFNIQKKLTATFRTRKNYSTSLQNFQFYIKNGMKVKKLNWAIQYYQTNIFKKWVEKCTALRNSTNMPFLISIAKLLVNASYGRLNLSVRNQKRIEIITNEAVADKVCRSLYLDSFRFIKPKMIQVEMIKKNIFFNSPIQIGGMVLEHSKYVMYQFYYDVLYPYFTSRLHLILHDTDSFFISIENCLWSEWEEFVRQNEDHFDLSSYPKDHFLFSLKNQRIPGKMKVEYADKIIKAVVAPRPKQYSILFTDGSEIKKLKGIKRAIVKKKINFVHYLISFLLNQDFKTCQTNFLSLNHRIFTTESYKSTLNCNDTKRFAVNLVETTGIGYSDSDTESE